MIVAKLVLRLNGIQNSCLQDCAPVKQTCNYSNLHMDSKFSYSHRLEEDFVGLNVNRILVLKCEALIRNETISGGKMQAIKHYTSKRYKNPGQEKFRSGGREGRV